MKDKVQQNGPNSAVYGLSFVEAVIYYIPAATGFRSGVVGFLKAIVWPAFLVFEALRAIHG
ncbi:MAG: hypothetical protein J4F31_08800 [Flavobacteriales bacterium]|nr:hypothetical protein [Flavobacteriales bacterium]